MSNKYLEKIAEVAFQSQQVRVADKVQQGPVLAVHSLGSGKTLTSLLSVLKVKERLGSVKALFIVPASLVNNIWKEIEKHEIDLSPAELTVVSYEAAARNPAAYAKKWDIVVMDEAHRLRNKGTQRSAAIDEILSAAGTESVLPMTATPVFNKPEDLGVLLNAATRKKVLPDEAKSFEQDFIAVKKVEGNLLQRIRGVQPGIVKSLKNQKALSEVLDKYVDYYDAMDSEGYAEKFPELTSDSTVEVVMSKGQQQAYSYLEGKLPLPIRIKIRSGLPLSKKESASLNSFSTGVRQASNTSAPFVTDPRKIESSKILKMVEDLKATPGKTLVYSNYMDAGLNPMKELLEAQGVSAEIYNGKLNARQKKDLERRYNNDEVNTLLVSSSGSEGLDLKGTRLVQIMEPHFNPAKIDQVIGRAGRYESHIGLDEEDRNYQVKRYISTQRPGLIARLRGKPGPGGIDQYLTDLSKEKAQITNEIVALMRKSNGDS